MRRKLTLLVGSLILAGVAVAAVPDIVGQIELCSTPRGGVTITLRKVASTPGGHTMEQIRVFLDEQQMDRLIQSMIENRKDRSGALYFEATIP